MAANVLEGVPMPSRLRRVRLLLPALAALGTAAATPAAHALPTAPGAPGAKEQFLPADKSGVVTSATTASKVWLTVQKEGGLGEVYYPDLGTPSARALRFVIADANGYAVRAEDAARVTTSQPDDKALFTTQTFRERGGRWQLATSYSTDPGRATALIGVSFAALDGRKYKVYAIYDPALANTRDDDTGRTDDATLVASDGNAASALTGRPAFGATSSGYRGTSDGWTDLLADGRLDSQYDAPAPGNV